MPISNNGPFELAGIRNIELRMFVCEDGIVVVKPKSMRPYLPGMLVGELLNEVIGGALGGAIGGGIEGAMAPDDGYQGLYENAKAVGFASAERLASSIPRSFWFTVDQVSVVRIRQWGMRLVFVMVNRVPRTFGRKLEWMIHKRDVALRAALKELFGERADF